MKTFFLYEKEAIDAINKFKVENDFIISSQLKIATNNFQDDLEKGNSFLMIIEKNSFPILWFGFQVNEEEKTINTPFFYIKKDIPMIIKGKSIKFATKVFKDLVNEFHDYSFFILAIPRVNKIISKLLTPPMQYIGVMKNYFVYENKTENGFLYWKPSNLQQ